MKTAQEIVDALNAVDSQIQQVECDTAVLDGPVARRWASTLNAARVALTPIVKDILALGAETENLAQAAPGRSSLDMGARFELLSVVGGDLDAAMQAQRWVEGDDSDNPHVKPAPAKAEEDKAMVTVFGEMTREQRDLAARALLNGHLVVVDERACVALASDIRASRPAPGGGYYGKPADASARVVQYGKHCFAVLPEESVPEVDAVVRALIETSDSRTRLATIDDVIAGRILRMLARRNSAASGEPPALTAGERAAVEWLKKMANPVFEVQALVALLTRLGY